MIPQLAQWHWSPTGIACDFGGGAFFVALALTIHGVRALIAQLREQPASQATKTDQITTHNGGVI